MAPETAMGEEASQADNATGPPCTTLAPQPREEAMAKPLRFAESKCRGGLLRHLHEVWQSEAQPLVLGAAVDTRPTDRRIEPLETQRADQRGTKVIRQDHEIIGALLAGLADE